MQSPQVAAWPQELQAEPCRAAQEQIQGQPFSDSAQLSPQHQPLGVHRGAFNSLIFMQIYQVPPKNQESQRDIIPPLREHGIWTGVLRVVWGPAAAASGQRVRNAFSLVPPWPTSDTLRWAQGLYFNMPSW